MNTLLTHGYFLEEDDKERKIMRPYPPLGLLYVSAFLDQGGVENEVFDTTFSSRAELFDRLLEVQPKYLGIYVNLMTKPNVINLIQSIRQSKELKHAVIFLGGPEVHNSHSKFLEHGADYVVMGEGEETSLELIQSLENQSEDLEDIPGLAFKRNGEVICTPERNRIKEIDQLPWPSRNKINIQRYLDAWSHHHGMNALSVSTMRGCPYTCKWCSRAVYGLSYRRRSPGNVVREIRSIQEEYKPDSLWFVDDVFTVSHKWLAKFKEELDSAGVKIPYECITRADRLNPEAIALLKETGCFRVWIGAESGSQRVIDLMDRRVEVSQVREMIQMAKSQGIETGTFIMLGYPGETEEDIIQTIDHLKRSDPDHFTITLAYPIRGTELFEEVTPLISNNLDWATTTDRQIDFKRTYGRRYYDYALRHVINEVNYHKARNNQRKGISAAGFKIKSFTAKLAMNWYRARTA